MNAAPSDREHTIAFGEHRAVVVEMGGGLRSYQAGGADVVDGYRRDEACGGGRGQLLIPWPNRISDGRYRFDGVDLQLPVNELGTGSAIHGLVRSMPWQVVDATGHSVSLALDLPPQQGYPFALGLNVAYTIDSDGLEVRTTATNAGTEPCPYGAGAHPYLRLPDGELIDHALLRIPAGVTLEADRRGIPTGIAVPVDGTDLDFGTGRRIGPVMLDTAYTSLRPDDDGVTRISLTMPGTGRGATLWMDAAHPYVMVYSGDTLPDPSRRRRGLAVEPMTCAPDAFNSGAGLIILQPGEQHSCTWGITPL